MEGPLRYQLPSDLKLIETLGWRYGPGFVHIRDHLERLERSARSLGIRYHKCTVEQALGRHAGGTRPLRIRLTLASDGTVEASSSPLGPTPTGWALAIAPDRLDPADPWLRLKSTMRHQHDHARATLPTGIDEFLFLNTRGQVAEGTITNVFLQRDGRLLTPPLDAGLLPGILRAVLLRERQAEEASLYPADLDDGPLFVGNSLRGLIPARLVRDSRPD